MQDQTSRPDTDHRTIFAAIAEWIRNYRGQLLTDRELAQCSPDEVAAMAQDLAISPQELRTLAHTSPDGARLLHRLLTALGVDERALSRRDPLLVRDLERLCVNCDHKRRCAHDLATGESAAHYREYCPNAYTLDMLFAAEKTSAAEKAPAEQTHG